MADNKRMALTESVRKQGQGGDRFVPSSSPRPRRGPVTRRGGASLRAEQAATRP
jgi:hypothetical protein